MQTEQRREIEQRLEQSRQVVRKAVENLTDPQWRFAPPEGGWTIAQCLEHLTYIETRIIDELAKTMESTPPETSWMETLADKEDLLKKRIPGRERKVVMPAMFDYPQGTKPGEKLIAEFEKARDRSVRFLMDTPEDIRLWAYDHAFFKMLHGGQWMWMIALHAERHAAQMDEVRGLAEFPLA